MVFFKGKASNAWDLLGQRNDGCHDSGVPFKDADHCLTRMLQTDDVSSEFFGVQFL